MLAEMQTGTFPSANQSLPGRWRNSMAEFLTIELYTANMFATFALAPCSLENRARYVYNARLAFDTVVRFVLRAALNRAEVTQVTEELHSVRSRLERLGEKDFGEVSVLDPFETASTDEKPREKSPNGDSKQRSVTIKTLGRETQRFEGECRQVRADCREMLAQNQALMKKKPGPDE